MSASISYSDVSTLAPSSAGKIDIASIDRSAFNVMNRDGRILVVPAPTKHRWTDEELHLRSLLLEEDGTIISTGFPKYFNYGERPEMDAEFHIALAEGRVEFTEKRDGSLIVADRIGGEPHLRTRGCHTLATDLADPVLRLIAHSYPEFPRLLREHPLLADYSLLMEYTAPTNRIVVQYEEPSLTLLALCSKDTVTPTWDRTVLASIASEVGLALPEVYSFENNLTGIVRQIGGWVGAEGVVARFFTRDGRPALLKLKSEWYRSLHSIFTGLTPKRAAKLAYLLGVEDEGQIAEAFHRIGVDHEGVTFVRPMVEEYIQRRRTFTTHSNALRDILAPVWPTCATRGEAVAAAREVIASDARFSSEPRMWLAQAIFFMDGRDNDAAESVAAMTLGITVQALRQWNSNEATLRETLGKIGKDVEADD